MCPKVQRLKDLLLPRRLADVRLGGAAHVQHLSAAPYEACASVALLLWLLFSILCCQGRRLRAPTHGRSVR